MATGQYDDELRGVLFRNPAKAQETDPARKERLPDYKGQAQVEHREYWLSAWLSKSQKGETFMKLSLQPKQAQATQGGVGVGGVPPAPATPDEEIPF